MSYSPSELSDIYNKTNGYCKHCGSKLAWSNYGRGYCERGVWQVDHGIPKSRDGTNHLNNLHPACSLCNLEKGDMTTSEFQRYIRRKSRSKQAFRQALRRKYC